MSTSPQRLAELNRIIDNALFELPKATQLPSKVATPDELPVTTHTAAPGIIIDDQTKTKPDACHIKATLFAATPKKRSPLEDLVGPYLDKYNIAIDSEIGKKVINYTAEEYLYKRSVGKRLTPNDMEYAVKLRIRESIENDLTQMGYTPQKSRELSLKYTATPESYDLNWASRAHKSSATSLAHTEETPRIQLNTIEDQERLNGLLKPYYQQYGLAPDSKIAQNALIRLKDNLTHYQKADDKDAAYAVRTSIREDIEAHLLNLGTPRNRIFGISREIIRTPDTYLAYAKAQQPEEEGLTFTLSDVNNFQLPEEHKDSLAGNN